MEIKMIEGKTFERLKQAIKELFERSKKLNSSTTLKEEWWTNQEVCRLLGISLRTLQNYRDKGLIPYSQIGHKCYYKVKDVEHFIEKNKG